MAPSLTKPKPAGIGGGVSAGQAAPSGTPPTPPASSGIGAGVEKIQPHLLPHGVQTSTQLNTRVQEITAAHVNALGYKPSPGLVYDVLRLGLPKNVVDGLFHGPQTAMDATAAGTARKANIGGGVSVTGIVGPSLAEQQAKARAAVKQLANAAYEMRGAAAPAYEQSAKQDALSRAETQGLGKVQASSLFDAQLLLREMGTAKSFGYKLFSQTIEGLIGTPYGFYIANKAVLLDAADLFTRFDVTPERTTGVGKAVVQGIKQDVTHPYERPGFLFLDALGLVTAGGGVVTRLGALGRAEGLAGKAAAVARRPNAGTFTIRQGNFAADKLLSENPVLRQAQRAYYHVLNTKLDRRFDETREIAGTSNGSMLSEARDAYARILGPEAKLRREAGAESRVEQALQMSLLQELNWMQGWSVVASRAFQAIASKAPDLLARNLPQVAKRGLSRGEQKAIQVLSLDSPNPLAQWRNLHQRIIDNAGEYAKMLGIQADTLVENHTRQLADLKLAERVLADPHPSERFQKALALTQEIISEQQRIKIETLGLSAESAARRVGAVNYIVESGKRVPDTLHTQNLLTKAQKRLTASQERSARLSAELDRIKERVADGREKPQFERDPKTIRAHQTTLGDLIKRRQSRVTKLSTKLASERAIVQGFTRGEGFYLPFVSKAHTRRASKAPAQVRPGEFGIPNPTMAERRALPELYHQFTGDSILAGDFRIDATRLAGEAYGRTVRVVSIWDKYNNLLSASTATPRSRFDIPIRDKGAISDALRERLARIDSGEFTAADAAALAPDDVKAILSDLFPDPKQRLEGVRYVDERLVGSRDIHQPGPIAKTAQVIQEPFRDTILYLRPAYALNLLGNAGMAWLSQGPLVVPNVTRAVFARHKYGDKVAAALKTIVGEGKSRSYVNPDITLASTKIGRGLASAWNRITDEDIRVSMMIYRLRRAGVKTQADMERVLFSTTPADRKIRIEAARRAKKDGVEFDNLTTFEKATIRNFVFVYPWVSRSAVWSIRALAEHPIKADILAQIAQSDDEWQNILAKAPDWFKLNGYFPTGYDAQGRPAVANPTAVNTWSTLGEMLSLGKGTFAGDPNAQALGDILGPVPQIGFQAAQRGSGGLPEALSKAARRLPQVSAVKKFGEKPVPGQPTKQRPPFIPGLHAAYGPLIAGGLAEKTVDLPALEARYWKEQGNTRARVRHEGQIAVALEKVNAKVIGRPLPTEVRQAVDFANELHLAEWDKTAEIGRDLTQLERTLLLIAKLEADGRIDAVQTQSFAKTAKAAVDGGKALRSRLIGRYANGSDFDDWHHLANTVLGFKDHALGRRYVEFSDQVAQLKTAARAAPQGAEQATDYAKVAEYAEQNPEMTRIDWGLKDADQQRRMLVQAAVAPWNWLGSYDKQLLGKNVAPKTAHGWAVFEQLRQDAINQLPAGQKRLSSAYAITLARYVNKHYVDGFYKDYLFSRQPLVRRLEVLNVWRDSKNAPAWRSLLIVASRYASYLDNPGYSKSGTRDAWKQYVDASLKPALASLPSFRAEVDEYGPQFLYNLLQR